MKHRLLLISTLITIPLFLNSQVWEVPPDRNAKLSPAAFTDEGRRLGEELYNLNCKSCHGDPGRANYNSQLNPLPGDPAAPKFQANSDGAMQYKISEGKSPMPSFRNILTGDEIWDVISYLRSFNSSYIQVVEVVQQQKNLRWSEIRIMVSFDADRNIVTATVKGLEKEFWTPVANTGVVLSARRYFGMLEIDEPKMTNNEGIATFSFPPNLPSERDGGISLTAMLADQDLFGTIRKDTVIAAGMANTAPSLIAKRAMWNVGRKAPLWILITYPAGVLLVWGFIFYVLFQLRTVYSEGNDNDEL